MTFANGIPKRLIFKKMILKS